jgi:ribose-phosphate pyrophosphokinase
VIADVLATARLERLLVVDPHNAAVEAGFECPVELLSAVPLLADSIRAHAGDAGVIVAPDLGATKLAERYAKRLGMPMALVHKQRLGPAEVVAEHVVGEVRGLTPVVVDDIVSTAGTMAAAVEVLLARGARPPVTLVATHGLFTGLAMERLRRLPLARVITTDSVRRPEGEGMPFEHDVVTVAPLVAEAIRREHA